ncbi:hypothetical protein HID58_056869 [Brassica napus]|uniref:COX assembly mitochondrial protein n=1 Tax=Brassica napus TaxID=3708 RepID=A0ABQ8APJ5_BRANA|nr:hypothetical protein HID58_056869 [Brassica napus]
MHPPLTPHRHPLCLEIIEEFQKCHLEHPIGKFFGECTELKVKVCLFIAKRVQSCEAEGKFRTKQEASRKAQNYKERRNCGDLSFVGY